MTAEQLVKELMLLPESVFKNAEVYVANKRSKSKVVDFTCEHACEIKLKVRKENE